MIKGDRLEQMHRFLDEHAREIREWEVGNLRFDWSGGDVKFHVGRSGKIRPTEERLSA